jgi:hypothetical protein
MHHHFVRTAGMGRRLPVRIAPEWRGAGAPLALLKTIDDGAALHGAQSSPRVRTLKREFALHRNVFATFHHGAAISRDHDLPMLPCKMSFPFEQAYYVIEIS